MVITPHAVERFVKRIVPDHSYDNARTLLSNRADSAVPLKQKTWGGQEALLVVKRDRGKRDPIVVTVVEPNEDIENEVPPEFMQRLAEQCEKDEQEYDLDERVKRAAAQLAHLKHNMRQEIHAAERKMRQARENARTAARKVLDESGLEVVTQLELNKLIPKF
jgi:hypothetical protein